MTPMDMSVIVFGVFAILFGIAALLMLLAWLKIHASHSAHVPLRGGWSVVSPGRPLVSNAKKTPETRS